MTLVIMRNWRTAWLQATRPLSSPLPSGGENGPAPALGTGQRGRPAREGRALPRSQAGVRPGGRTRRTSARVAATLLHFAPDAPTYRCRAGATSPGLVPLVSRGGLFRVAVLRKHRAGNLLLLEPCTEISPGPAPELVPAEPRLPVGTKGSPTSRIPANPWRGGVGPQARGGN